MNKKQKLFLVAVAVACSVILAGLTYGALTGINYHFWFGAGLD